MQQKYSITFWEAETDCWKSAEGDSWIGNRTKMVSDHCTKHEIETMSKFYI